MVHEVNSYGRVGCVLPKKDYTHPTLAPRTNGCLATAWANPNAVFKSSLKPLFVEARWPIMMDWNCGTLLTPLSFYSR
jgi:hypothetical protein